MKLAVAALLAMSAGLAPAPSGPPPHTLVLCYHRFGPEKESDPYQISLERFEGQLAMLQAPSKAYNSNNKVKIPSGVTKLLCR